MIFGMFRSWSARKTGSVIFRNEKLKLSLSKLEQLPSLSETAARAIALAKDPQTPVKEFVSLIKRDGALTAAILKAANNVHNAGAHAVGSIERAIERLGLHACSRTIEAFGMKESFRPTGDRTREVCQLLWRHSFFTANVCRGLNRSLRLGFGGEEFCAGMLHDVGRLIIAASDIDNFAMVDQMDFNEGPETLENELKYWDTPTRAGCRHRWRTRSCIITRRKKRRATSVSSLWWRLPIRSPTTRNDTAAFRISISPVPKRLSCWAAATLRPGATKPCHPCFQPRSKKQSWRRGL